MDSPPERLFVSLSLPDTCRSVVTKLYDDKLEGFTWTRPEQLHLTMRFMGNVEVDLAERVDAALAKIRVKSFLLPLEGVGRFPPRGPVKILSVGVGRGNTLLFQLRQKIDDALLAAGWRGELRNFNPHITVARIQNVPPEVTDDWLIRNQRFVGPLFRVGRACPKFGYFV